MPRPRKSVPAYSHHKARDLAYVRVPDGNGGRKTIYLGRHNSLESQAEYRRILAELQLNPDRPVAEAARVAVPVVDEVLAAFMKHAVRHYRDADGKPTTELDEVKRSLAPLRRLYGPRPVTEFGPLALKSVRQEMISAGWCRTLINHRIDRIKRAFRWATAEELVPVSVYQSLRTLAGLQRGRTEVRESKPIGPVDPAHVAATLPYLNPHVRAMVQVQQLTGMRPGELCKLTLAEVDSSADVWIYRPALHKTAHRGKVRIIPIGPRAQAVIVAFLVGDHPPPVGFDQIGTDETARLVAADAYQEAGRDGDAALLRDLARPVAFVGHCVVDPMATVFSPSREREERFRRLRANRKTKVQPSQASRKKKNPKRVPSGRYKTHAYYGAVGVAARKAGMPSWHPNQLRHLFATDVRKAHGLEAAGAVLGHAKMSVTEVYAERDTALAVRIAAAMG